MRIGISSWSCILFSTGHSLRFVANGSIWKGCVYMSKDDKLDKAKENVEVKIVDLASNVREAASDVKESASEKVQEIVQEVKQSEAAENVKNAVAEDAEHVEAFRVRKGEDSRSKNSACANGKCDCEKVQVGGMKLIDVVWIVVGIAALVGMRKRKNRKK